MTIQTFTVMNDRDIANPPRNETLDESELVRRIQAGDGAAYETLVREYGGRLQAVARRYLRCDQDAADAVQDAFMSAFQAIASFQGSSKLSTWLQRIVINACLMKLRSHSRRPAISMEELLPVFDATGHHIGGVSPWKQAPLQQVLDGELRTAVRQAIDQLPEIYRTVLLLRDIQEIDTDETADMLKVTQAVVKTRLHRARQALRTLLEPMFVGEE